MRRHCCCYLSAAAHAMQCTACACRTTCNVHFVIQHVAWTSKLRATGGHSCSCCYSAEAALSKRLARMGLEAVRCVLHAVCRMEQAVCRMPHLACLMSNAARWSGVSRDSRFAPRSHRAPQMDEHFLKHAGGRAAVEAALRGPANLALLAATVRPDGQAVRSAPRFRDRGVRDTVAFGIPWRSGYRGARTVSGATGLPAQLVSVLNSSVGNGPFRAGAQRRCCVYRRALKGTLTSLR